MATLANNIQQAIADFDSIRDAINNKGVLVSDSTPTSMYGDKISLINGGKEDDEHKLVDTVSIVYSIPYKVHAADTVECGIFDNAVINDDAIVNYGG